MFRHTVLVDPAERLQSDFADPVTDPEYEFDHEAAVQATEPIRPDEASCWKHVETNQPSLFVLDGMATQTLALTSAAPDAARRQVVRLPSVVIERAGAIAAAMLTETSPQRVVVLRTIEPHQAVAMNGMIPAGGSLVLVLANSVVQQDDDWLKPLWQQSHDASGNIRFAWVKTGFIGGLAAAMLAECSWRKIAAVVFLAVEDEDGPNCGTMQALIQVTERLGSLTSTYWNIEKKRLRLLQATRHQLYV